MQRTTQLHLHADEEYDEWFDSQPPVDAGEILVFCGDGNYRFCDAAEIGVKGINWEFWSKPWQLRKAASSE